MFDITPIKVYIYIILLYKCLHAYNTYFLSGKIGTWGKTEYVV